MSREEERVYGVENEHDEEFKRAFANRVLADVKKGLGFMLPTQDDLLGGISFWDELKKGFEEMYGGRENDAYKAAEFIYDILSNSGGITRNTFLEKKAEINNAINTMSPKQEDRMAV
jgi:hypothetical protein